MKRFQRVIGLSLSVFLLSGTVLAAINDDMLTADVRVTVTPANLKETAPIPGAFKKVNMAFHGVAIQDALRALARQGGFNVLIDESVQGSISVNLNNVSIQDALETLKTYGHLAYSVQGNNLAVADAESEKGKAYQKTVTRIIPLKNANAKVVSNLLNQTIFADRVQGANAAGVAQGLPVTADYHTNSLVVVGSPTDIKTVMEHVEVLDQPRQQKTWRLSQANVLDVATILSSSLFNEGQPAVVVNGGSASSTGTGANGAQNALSSSTLRVTADNIAEGSGASQSSQSGGNSSSSGGSGSSGQTAVINNLTVRDRKKETQNIQISPMGAILIPDTRLNTLTLLGTAEQIAVAEALIPTLDRKVPQVVLEASLVEISEGGRKELGFNHGYNGRITSTGSNNSPGSASLSNKPYSNPIGLATSALSPFETLFQISNKAAEHKKDFLFQLNALISKNKAKILANPTVVTASDNEAIVSIVDEIIKSVTITQGFGLPPTATDNIGEAGIVLNILPKVGPDGSVSLRIRPVISTVADTRRDRYNNMVTLLSKREVITQNVVLRDGETFVLGGLVHNTNAQVVRNTPVLSQLPIVGALARNSTGTRNRTELVILITPHIVNDDPQIARSNPGNPKSSFQASSIVHPSASSGVVPVSFGSRASSVLPPLESVRVLGDSSGKTPAYPVSGSRNTAPSQPLSMEPTGSTAPLGPDELSDEKIRAIINRFK
jgi:type II secretory pathway component GspD/PulD (secretin)